MSPRLPPLHLLRIFEAAGRRQSFKQAAADLHLTPSAVSHQVKALEEFLGVDLFRRSNRRIQLTTAGHQYLAVVEDVFARLQRGTQSLQKQAGRTLLRLSAHPSMVTNFIIPRLGRFQSQFPDIELRIQAGLEHVDLRHEDLDLAIVIGHAGGKGIVADKLFELEAEPLCSPQFARRHRLRGPDQLTALPWIALPKTADLWPTWCAARDQPSPAAESRVEFGSYEAAIVAACEGYGVAIGLLPLESPRLQSGQLHAPFAAPVTITAACYAAYRTEDRQRTEVHAFTGWLRETIAREPHRSRLSSDE